MAFASNPNGFEDIVELLVPELQRRGLMKSEYTVPGGTLRENLLATRGQKHLRDDHYGATFAWERNQGSQGEEKDGANEKVTEAVRKLATLHQKQRSRARMLWFPLCKASRSING